MTTHPYLEKMISTAVTSGPARVAVTYPCSANSIEAAVTAHNMGLIEPLMVGPRSRITSIADENAIDLGNLEFIETGEDPMAAAHASVSLCRDQAASAIMKGSLHTDELLAAVVSKESGLRTGRRISHAFVFDMPKYAKPLLMADCVVNITPGLMEKRDIIQNTIDLAHALAEPHPYVAILSAVETINPAIPGTLEAAALSKMAKRGQITGAIVDGPLSFDVAVSELSARIKGVELLSTELPDILIMPNLEAGNMLYKELIYFAEAECAGLILGAKVPVILTSRADSAASRVASCALAAISARSRGNADGGVVSSSTKFMREERTNAAMNAEAKTEYPEAGTQ
jgi:phosphate acetyltransferase